MILSKAALIFIGSAVGTASASGHCEDNTSFQLNGFPVNTCAWIRENIVNIDGFCRNGEIKENCKKLCNLCAEDVHEHSGNVNHPATSPSEGETRAPPSSDADTRTGKGNGVVKTKKSSPTKGKGSDGIPSSPTKGKGSDGIPSSPTKGKGSDGIPSSPTKGKGSEGIPSSPTKGKGSDGIPSSPTKGKGSSPESPAKGKGKGKGKGSVPTAAPTVDGEETNETTLTPTSNPSHKPSIEEQTDPETLAPTVCADDLTYISPIADGATCAFFEQASCECMRWGTVLDRTQLQELFDRCPKSCGVECGYVIENVPTQSPTRDGCSDNPDYRLPIFSGFGCSFFSKTTLTCEQLGSEYPQYYDDLLQNCPISCDAPCPDDVSPPTPAPYSCVDDELYVNPITNNGGCDFYSNLDSCENIPVQYRDEAIRRCPLTCNACDSACQDNPSYVSPLNNAWGCDMFANNGYTCSDFENMFESSNDFNNLFSNCPATCGVCNGPSQPTSAPTVRNNAGETTLSPTESTRSPTQHPSKSPTTSPSSKPSSKPSSSPTRSKILPDVPSCQDNSDYINPIDESQGGCEFFAQFTNDDGGCDCSIWEFFLQDPLDILGMYMNCPATCNVSCEEPIITTDAPTSAPFECFDDRNYVNPIPFLDGDGCNAFETVDCTTLSFLAADVYEALLRSCPVSCDLCGDDTDPSTLAPTKAPTKGPTPHPTSRPTSSPSVKPSSGPSVSSSASPTDCYDNRNFINPIQIIVGDGCDAFASIECTGLEPFVDHAIFNLILTNCPVTCGLCGERPSSSPTIVDPTDPETLTPTKTPSKSPSLSPSLLPSILPSNAPSFKPSSTASDTPSASPTDCFDDRSYENPFEVGSGCGYFSRFTTCSEVRQWMEPAQYAELLLKCPKTCGVPCGATPPPTVAPTSGPTEMPSIAPSNCPTLPQCQAYICVSPEDENQSLESIASSSSNSNRSNINGPLNGNTTSTFGPDGSSFESITIFESSSGGTTQEWYEVVLQTTYRISRIRIFACQGSVCFNEDAKKLENVRLDIFKDGNTIAASYTFIQNFGDELDVILPFQTFGVGARLTKLNEGEVLSISEFEVFGVLP